MKEKVTILAKSEQELSSISAPLFSNRPQAGFPVSTDATVEESLDLNHLIVKNPAATFFVRVEGDSMKDSGISSGDILAVDRSREPKHGSIVIASVFGELTIKRLALRGGSVFLVPENDEYEEVEITEEMESSIWGVVTHAVTSFV